MTCQMHGADLATITSDKDNILIESLLMEGMVGEAYIGLTDYPNDGKFRWVNGDPSSYRQNQKSSAFNTANRFDCVSVNISSGVAQWIGGDCTHPKPFICSSPVKMAGLDTDPVHHFEPSPTPAPPQRPPAAPPASPASCSEQAENHFRAFCDSSVSCCGPWKLLSGVNPSPPFPPPSPPLGHQVTSMITVVGGDDKAEMSWNLACSAASLGDVNLDGGNPYGPMESTVPSGSACQLNLERYFRRRMARGLVGLASAATTP